MGIAKSPAGAARTKYSSTDIRKGEKRQREVRPVYAAGLSQQGNKKEKVDLVAIYIWTERRM